jgi:hypothetical protein
MRSVSVRQFSFRVVCESSDLFFLLATDHSAEVASQCVEWMRTGGFLGDLGI